LTNTKFCNQIFLFSICMSWVFQKSKPIHINFITRNVIFFHIDMSYKYFVFPQKYINFYVAFLYVQLSRNILVFLLVSLFLSTYRHIINSFYFYLKQNYVILYTYRDTNIVSCICRFKSILLNVPQFRSRSENNLMIYYYH